LNGDINIIMYHTRYLQNFKTYFREFKKWNQLFASFNDTTCLPGGSERSCIRMDLVNHMIDTIKIGEFYEISLIIKKYRYRKYYVCNDSYQWKQNQKQSISQFQSYLTKFANFSLIQIIHHCIFRIMHVPSLVIW
jgi:hypothetical protein